VSLIISFIVPAVDITLEKTATVKTELERFETELHPVGTVVRSIAAVNESGFSIERILMLSYSLIASVIFLKGAFDISRLLRKAGRAHEKQGGLKIYYGLEGMGNSSFFNLVFLESRQISDLQKLVILTHERVHADKGHSVDKLFMLVCRSVLWFNPLIYLYEQELENVHEFEADALSAGYLGRKRYAQSLVDLAKERQRIYPAHSLSTHPLKSRIARLFAPETAHTFRWRYLLPLPLVVAFMIIFSLRIVYASPINTGFILVVDAAHGGRDLGSTSENVNEKELVLDIAKRIAQKGSLAGIEVLLTRKDDSELKLKQRAKNKGDLLISLHVDSAAIERAGIRILRGDKSALVKQNEEAFIAILQSQFSSNNSGFKVDENITLSPQLYLLRQYSSPSVVLELGNLKNDGDRTRLSTALEREAMAENIITSVARYKKQVQQK
jgi:N-acetylmuramoyl-L-alanine amidase